MGTSPTVHFDEEHVDTEPAGPVKTYIWRKKEEANTSKVGYPGLHEGPHGQLDDSPRTKRRERSATGTGARKGDKQKGVGLEGDIQEKEVDAIIYPYRKVPPRKKYQRVTLS